MGNGRALFSPLFASALPITIWRIAVKHYVNLLPPRTQCVFEHWRQVRRWSVAWCLTGILLLTGFCSLDHRRDLIAKRLDATTLEVAPLRQTEAECLKIQGECTQYREMVETARAIEQTDAPLALLQVVSDSVSELGSSIKLDALRMDEISGDRAVAGQLPSFRKQLQLTGSADADTLVTALVTRLRACQVFRTVELESSRAFSDQSDARRSFQIRCQQ